MRSRWIDKLTKQTVVLHLSDGVSMRGILFEVFQDSLIMVETAYLGEGEETRVDGEVVVPRENVSWLQVLGNVGGLR